MCVMRLWRYGVVEVWGNGGWCSGGMNSLLHVHIHVGFV